MSVVIFITLGLIFLGIGIYQLIHSKPRERVEFGKPAGETVSGLTVVDYHQALLDAIEVAIADGTLTKKEEALLRDKAKQAGKDPDELILQLREDLMGMEDSETELVDTRQRAGLDFEKYVVQKFNAKFFKINQWAGDKFVAGRYAESTLEPDIHLTLVLDKLDYPLAVECKWRTDREDDFIRFADDQQLVRYQEYGRRTGKPTFIVLGVGGKPSEPEAVFIIPIGAFKKGIQHKRYLNKYKKRSMDRDFFYDPEKGELW